MRIKLKEYKELVCVIGVVILVASINQFDVKDFILHR